MQSGSRDPAALLSAFMSFERKMDATRGQLTEVEINDLVWENEPDNEAEDRPSDDADTDFSPY